MWRQLNTRTLASQFGMWAVKIKSVHCGDTTSRIPKVKKMTKDFFFLIVQQRILEILHKKN